jgi:hypothetical protein
MLRTQIKSSAFLSRKGRGEQALLLYVNPMLTQTVSAFHVIKELIDFN